MAKSDKPNILIIWGDDIGYWNISRYSMGMMGYPTPNIDRIGAEGATFTDWYGQQSCTAGRACFITGQNPIRTGLTTCGYLAAGVLATAEAEDPPTPKGYTRPGPVTDRGRAPGMQVRLVSENSSGECRRACCLREESERPGDDCNRGAGLDASSVW